MQLKIYVVGMFDAESAEKVQKAVEGVANVSKVVANADKAQVLVDHDGADETAINAAITSCGVDVVG